ncbi:MAG: hypothetical protein SPE48_05345 [Treponema porcinum]|uniref:hypothetical protein n=1 Tax=Treponema porcinum TaxID=261392 RepID=UPI002354A399|nr:hypothetical protein [Treponema porcinum]MCI6481778.1 hypothetical protein [Treponema porcinum]MDY5121325.1 hypothetical protein [Treponema porcinum]
MTDFDIKVSAFCNSVQIDYGIINGKFNIESSHIVVYIKAGLTGSIYGYENKYLKMAKNLNEKFGVSVFVASNPEGTGNSIGHGLQIFKNYCKERQVKQFNVYFVGVSNGGVQGLFAFEKNPLINKALLIGAPLNYNPDLIKKALINFNGEKLHLICGDKDPGFGLFKLYSELENEKIIFTAFLNVDHVFSGNTELFIKLPEKYLF